MSSLLPFIINDIKSGVLEVLVNFVSQLTLTLINSEDHLQFHQLSYHVALQNPLSHCRVFIARHRGTYIGLNIPQFRVSVQHESIPNSSNTRGCLTQTSLNYNVKCSSDFFDLISDSVDADIEVLFVDVLRELRHRHDHAFPQLSLLLIRHFVWVRMKEIMCCLLVGQVNDFFSWRFVVFRHRNPQNAVMVQSDQRIHIKDYQIDSEVEFLIVNGHRVVNILLHDKTHVGSIQPTAIPWVISFHQLIRSRLVHHFHPSPSMLP